MFGRMALTSPRAIQLRLPLFSMSVSAGPPTPADDHVEERIDLTDLLVKQPDSTFLVRVTGESMIDASVEPGDILVVDRSVEPRNNDHVVAIVNGEFTLKSFVKQPFLHLASRNPEKPTVYPEFEVWGVVLWVLHRTRFVLFALLFA